MRIAFAAVALATAVTGCAASSGYAYRPTAQTAREDAPAEVAGAKAAAYRVPEVAPRGDVQVAALGVTRDKLLHVRMIVRNAGGEPWTVDAADQLVAIDGASRLRLAQARCDGDVMSLLVVMPGESRTLDLYYELPAPARATAAIPSVRVEWRVSTPSGALASNRTAFERHELPPPPVPPPDPKKMAHDLAETRHDWGSGCPQSVARSRSAVCGATF